MATVTYDAHTDRPARPAYDTRTDRPTQPAAKNFFVRIFEAMMEAQMRKAEIEVQRHRRLLPPHQLGGPEQR